LVSRSRRPAYSTRWPDKSALPAAGPEGRGAAAADLKKRTLTNLYNERPAWLAAAHRRLDEAVAAAYGWPPDLSDDELLARLLALNRSRAGTAAGEPEE
jgi:hypothetical protein